MTDEQKQKEEITQALQGFLTEMFAWEDNANHHFDIGEDIPDEELVATLKVIYDKYVVDKVRKMGRLECMSVGFPPQFNPEQENITEITIKGNTASVWVKGKFANWEMERLYKFKKVAGAWRLDNVKELDSDGKWYSIHI